MEWSQEMRYPDFATLWNELSDGVLNDEIEQTRWRFGEGDTVA